LFNPSCKTTKFFIPAAPKATPTTLLNVDACSTALFVVASSCFTNASPSNFSAACILAFLNNESLSKFIALAASLLPTVSSVKKFNCSGYSAFTAFKASILAFLDRFSFLAIPH
jgi:hypothetical protein